MSGLILTGAPGAGKTTILEALAGRGIPVVAEAATDVMRRRMAMGEAEPWRADDFISDILSLQLSRASAAPAGAVHDRSVICTLALCRYLDRPVPPELLAACKRAPLAFERRVFFVGLLGFIINTDARRISYGELQRFESFHREAYCTFGFDLIEVPPGSVAERADQILAAV